MEVAAEQRGQEGRVTAEGEWWVEERVTEEGECWGSGAEGAEAGGRKRKPGRHGS